MAFAKLNSMKFVGLDGLSHFWSKAKTLIMGQITAEVTARENADTALQQSITDLEASVDEKIGSIDISAALSHIKQYDFVVDSNETLLAWANCTDGSMKSVLVKSGEYTLGGKMLNLVNAGTKCVFAEDGNKITVLKSYRGIGATENYGAVIVGLNIEVDYSSKNGSNFCYAFYRGMICYNCTGNYTGTGDVAGARDVKGAVFYNCTCSNCTGTSNCTGYGYGYGYGFYECTCSNCTGNGTGFSATKASTGGGTGCYECTCSNCTGNGNCTGSKSSAGYGYGFYNCTCSNCTGNGNCTGTDSSDNDITTSGFYNCTCSNCTGNGNYTGTGFFIINFGFYNCTCSNCTGTGTGTGDGYGFYKCKHCSSCRAGDTASTTATWGGTNTYIDSDSCDYVAA